MRHAWAIAINDPILPESEFSTPSFLQHTLLYCYYCILLYSPPTPTPKVLGLCFSGLISVFRPENAPRCPHGDYAGRESVNHFVGPMQTESQERPSGRPPVVPQGL